MDLEDEQLRKLLASPLYIQEREENEGQTQAYHSERESLMINSSRSPSWSFRETWCSFHAVNRVKTLFPKGTEVMNWETFSRVVFVLSWVLLTQQMLGNFILMWAKIICLIRQFLKLRSRNIKWNLLTVVSMSFSSKIVLKDWNWRTPITDILNLE